MAYIRESKRETVLVYVSRGSVKETINLAPYGYTIAETLYGESKKGAKLIINSRNATSGIWRLK
jgi:hypothetical protein